MNGFTLASKLGFNILLNGFALLRQNPVPIYVWTNLLGIGWHPHFTRYNHMLHTRAIKCCAIGRLFVYRFRFTHSSFFFSDCSCVWFSCVFQTFWNFDEYIQFEIFPASLVNILRQLHWHWNFSFFSTHFWNRLLDFPAPNINTNSDEMYKKCFANGWNRQICLMSHRHLWLTLFSEEHVFAVNWFNPFCLFVAFPFFLFPNSPNWWIDGIGKKNLTF